MKKVKKAFKLAVLTCICTALLSGCGFDYTPESLLSAPKLTNEQSAVYDALILSTGDQIELAYPKSGQYRSAFVLYDIDDDGSDEAIVFYRSKVSTQEESSLRMNFLDKKSGEWISVRDKALAGASVEYVDFIDFGKGTDIVVSCNALSQNEQAAFIMSYRSSIVTELYRSNYVYLEAVDFNNSGFSQMFLINYDAALGCHTACLLGSSQDSAFGVLSSVSLSADAASFLRLGSQRLGEDDTLLFLDYSKGDNAYGTQILRCYSSNLTQVSESSSRRVNSNTPLLYSTDVDLDGRIEIPVTNPLPGYENLTIPEQLFSVDWYYADEDQSFYLTKKYTAFISPAGDYMFYIPVRWQGLVTVERNGSLISFVKYDAEVSEDSSFGEPLLTLTTSDPKESDLWDGEWDEFVGGITVYINDYGKGSEMSLTEDELMNCLVIF